MTSIEYLISVRYWARGRYAIDIYHLGATWVDRIFSDGSTHLHSSARSQSSNIERALMAALVSGVAFGVIKLSGDTYTQLITSTIKMYLNSIGIVTVNWSTDGEDTVMARVTQDA